MAWWEPGVQPRLIHSRWKWCSSQQWRKQIFCLTSSLEESCSAQGRRLEKNLTKWDVPAARATLEFYSGLCPVVPHTCNWAQKIAGASAYQWHLEGITCPYPQRGAHCTREWFSKLFKCIYFPSPGGSTELCLGLSILQGSVHLVGKTLYKRRWLSKVQRLLRANNNR